MMAASATALHRSLYGRAPVEQRRGHVDLAEKLRGMGVLARIDVRRPNGALEEWTFAVPRPRLCYTKLNASTSSGSQLWIVGGSYRVGSSGFRNERGGGQPMRSLSHAVVAKANRELEDAYRQTHGGLASKEAFAASIDLSREVVYLGQMEGVFYISDKNEGGGSGLYHHPFADNKGPSVAVTADGRQLILVGGHYSVTPHGIEDR